MNRSANKRQLTINRKPQTTILLLIVLVALGVRLFFMYALESYIIPNDWAFGYETGRIASAIAAGQGFSSPFPEPTGPTALVPPLYPYFLALIFRLFGIYSTASAIVILTLHCVISALTVIPIYFIGKNLFGKPVGYITAAVFALHPAPVWYAINAIWDTTIFTFLSMMLMLWLLHLPPGLNHKNGAVFGFFMGILILVKSVIAAFYPFMLIWLFLRSPAELKKKAASLGIICVITFLTLVPWLMRNYAVFGKFMLRSNLGLELSLENCQETWDALEAGAKSDVFIQRHPTINLGEFLVYKSLGEVSYMNLCLDKALTFIRENPEKYLTLTRRRISAFWLGYWDRKDEWRGNLRFLFSVSGFKKLFLISPLPFMLLGIVSGLKRDVRNISVPLAYIFFLPITYYLTHSAARFRFPIEPMILVLAVYGCLSLVPVSVKERFPSEQ